MEKSRVRLERLIYECNKDGANISFNFLHENVNSTTVFIRLFINTEKWLFKQDEYISIGEEYTVYDKMIDTLVRHALNKPEEVIVELGGRDGE